MSYSTKNRPALRESKTSVQPMLLLATAGSLALSPFAGAAPQEQLIVAETTTPASGLRVDIADAKAPADRLVYKEVIAPLLRGKCYECHAGADQNPSGKKKIKGKLELTSIAAIKKGGAEDVAAVPGDAEHSLMIERIKMPIDDDEHMPPEDKPQIEKHELAILEWWIKSNLIEGKTLKEAGAPAEIISAAGKLKTEDQLKSEIAAKAAADKAKADASAAQRKELEGAIATVSKDFPNALGFVSQQDSDLTFTAVSVRKGFKDEHLAKLEPVASGLVDLNLGSTSVTDAGAATLSKMPKLRKLWLNGTGVTDGGLDAVAGLNELEYLNLYGTQVTDEGLKKLGGLKNLKKLYLWQTKVTPAAADEFKKRNPDCEVNLGISTS